MKKPTRLPRTAVQHKTTKRPPGLKIKTKVRAAGIEMQHNGTLNRPSGGDRPHGLKIKTKVRAAGTELQHNEILSRA